ncbi:MAG: ArnT family glycosyltransferase [Candidatus Dormibacteria bacterium]
MLAVAAGLRLWGIGFGLPALLRPDEDIVLNRSLGVMAGQWNVHFADWPSLYFYVLALPLTLLAEARHALGVGPAALPDAARAAALEPGPWILVARLLNTGWGLLLVWLTWSAGRRALGPWPGLLAAGLASVSLLGVRESHFALFDPPAAAAAAGCVWLAVRAWSHDGRGRTWAPAGVLAGVAAALKFHPGAVGLVPAVLAWRRGWRPLAWVLGGAALAALVLFTSLYVDPGQVAGGLGHALFAFGHNRRTSPVPMGFFYLSQALPAAVGLPGLALWLVAAGRALRRRDWLILALALHTALTVAILSPARTGFFRYLLPLLPSISIVVSAGARTAWEWLVADRADSRQRVAVAAALAGLVLLAPLGNSLSFDRLISTTDTREVAYRFLVETFPPGTSLANGYFNGVVHGAAQVRDNAGKGAGPAAALILGRPSPFRVSLLDDEDPLGSAARVDPAQVEVVVLAPRAPSQRFTDAERRQIAQMAGRVFLDLQPEAPGESPVYDPIDSFFIPISGFDGVAAPGPEIIVYAPRRTA